MKHARPDYNRIQDPDDKIPEDEPVFLLRAQDVTAPFLVRMWAQQAESFGAKQDIVDAARRQAANMTEWQREHGMKIPDMPTSFATAVKRAVG